MKPLISRVTQSDDTNISTFSHYTEIRLKFGELFEGGNLQRYHSSAFPCNISWFPVNKIYFQDLNANQFVKGYKIKKHFKFETKNTLSDDNSVHIHVSLASCGLC